MGKLGNYDIETELGRGSMGVVYLAHDARLQRRVALKAIHVPAGLDPSDIESFRERFLREAQAAGCISHPGIVTIYGVDESPEEVLPFIAMEYVAGSNLRQILKLEGRIEPQNALSIADDLADALHTAHDAGVIHRDIKPANVLVRDSDGAVKIADFGVAQLSLEELTRSGELVGSPAYMAPEQIRHGEADGRSDLFSLAVMLYEMLSGVRPFAGKDMAEIIHQVVYQEPVPITQLVDDLPGVINAFFDRALAKSPRDRFQNGAEFRQALNDVQLEYQINRAGGISLAPGSSPTGASPFIEGVPKGQPAPTAETESDTHRLRQYLALALLLALFLLGWVIWGPSGKSGPVDPPQGIDTAAPGSVEATGAGGALTVHAGLPLVEDPALGESVLTEGETAAEPEPATPAATKPPKKKTTPPKAKTKTGPRSTAPPPVTEIAETPDGLAGSDLTAGQDQAETGDTDTAPPVVVPEPAQLTLVTRSALRLGTMTLFVDGEETLSVDLASDNKAITRFYRKALGRAKPSEAGVLDLTPGQHEILVRITRPDKDKVREASIDVDLSEGEARSLVIVAGRLFRSGVALRLE